MEKQTYIKGFYCKKPHANAPDFVKAKISIKREEMIKTLESMTTEWINLDLKEGQDGTYYTKIDDWKPNSQTVASNIPDGEF